METFDTEIRLHIGKRLSASDISSLSALAPGFTVYEALGYWQGKPERASVVSIFTTKEDSAALEYKLKVWSLRLDEDCVLLSVAAARATLPPGRAPRERYRLSRAALASV